MTSIQQVLKERCGGLFVVGIDCTEQLKLAIVTQLEKSGLIVKVSGHTNRYALSEEYHQLVNDGLKIGKRYVAKEVELIVLALQGNALKVGDLEPQLSASLTRNQIKYLLTKLMEDGVVKVEGKIRGARYSLDKRYADLRGDLLVNEVVNKLKEEHE